MALPYIYHRFRGSERDFRLGKLNFKFFDSIWIHAASVGEVNAVKPLIKELLRNYENTKIVISTITTTGYSTALKIDPRLSVFIFPFDIYYIMKRVFNALQPKLILLVETEFWPNMLLIAKQRKIPIIMVNARLSRKSIPKYKALWFFWKPLWKSIVAVNAQSRLDAYIYKGLGFKNVINAKNLKFCVNLPLFEKLRAKYFLNNEDFVVVFGSCRSKEEWLIRSIFDDLHKNISKLKIIIVPRHLERVTSLEEAFHNLDYQLLSRLHTDYKYLIVDKMGVLNEFYAMADIAVVCGSFYEYGGHNPFEPAFYQTPIVMGMHFQSCLESVNKLKKNSAIVISERNNLAANIIKLSKNREFAVNLGRNAKRTLSENDQSLKANLDVIDRYISITKEEH